MKLKKSVLALLVSLSLAGCAAEQTRSSAPATPAVDASAEQTQQLNIQQQPLAGGLYEMALSQDQKTLYVASAEGFSEAILGGVVYQLDSATLKTTALTHTDLKNFGVVMDPEGHTLYVTNTVDGSVSAIDTSNGKVKGRLLFTERNNKGYPYGTREIIWHNGLLYISGVADPGVIWVVDSQKLKLKSRINNAGKWVTGLLYSEQTQRLYAANGGGEILVINPRNNRIETRWKPLKQQDAMFLNLAEDKATGRLFVTDNGKAKTTLVLDIHTGELLKQLDVGDSLAVKFNPQRNEIYISQRESGKVISLDGSTYAVKQSWELPPNPNSLLLSADGQTLYVTVKQPHAKDYSLSTPDSVVRIQLNQ